MTTVSSCRMMLAVMYGMIPSAKIDSCRSAPPLNRLISAIEAVTLDRRQAALHRWVVDARRGNEGTDPVDRDHAEREEHLGAQVRRTERLTEHSQHHSWSSRRMVISGTLTAASRTERRGSARA